MDDDLRKTLKLSYLDVFRLWLAWGVARDKLIPAIKDFFWNETAFVRYGRALVYALSVAISQGQIPVISATKWGWWLAQFLPVMALMLGAGDKNRSAEEIKAIASGADK